MSDAWEKVLTAGAIRNGNISFKKCPFSINLAFVGGTNANAPALREMTVRFIPGATTKQWLYSDKMLFANRNPSTKDFFARIGAREGTVIRIRKVSEDSLEIEKA